MSRKQFALIAAICGGVTFLGVLLPWISVDMGPLGSHSANGTEGEFKGLWVLFLGLIAGAAALLVYLGKTDLVPIDERQHLFVGVGVFGLAAILTLTDFLRDWPEQVSRGIGLWLTLLATIGGGVVCFLAARGPQSSASAGPADTEPVE